MSTRCTVFVEKKNNLTEIYYHHHDGYPDGVGRALIEVPQAKRTQRKAIEKGLETRFGRASELEFEKEVKTTEVSEMFKPMTKPDPETGARGGRYDNTSLEGNHHDIEWRYRILLDGSLEIDSINTGESWKIDNQHEFETLSKRVEDDINGDTDQGE
jgi:hypothetical protein